MAQSLFEKQHRSLSVSSGARPPPLRRFALILMKHGAVDAPRSAAREHDVEEDEAVEDGGIAAVHRGVEGSRKMRQEVSDRHISGEHEGHRPCVDTKKQKKPADGFQNPWT